jgi:hypothetical protein
MTFLGVALSRMTWGVCKPPLADFGGREKREVFICHHSMMQRPLSILPLKAYPIGNTFIAQMFTSAHMSIYCGLPGAAKVRYDPCHHPGLNTRCFRSHGLV